MISYRQVKNKASLEIENQIIECDNITKRHHDMNRTPWLIINCN